MPTQTSSPTHPPQEISPLPPPPGKYRHPAKRYRTQLASAAGTVTSHVLAFPLFSATRRIQTFDTDLLSCLRKVYATEGMRGFFRGMWQPMFTITAARMVTFSVYQQVKYRTSAAIGKITGTIEPLLIVNQPGTLPSLATAACFGIAGGCGGLASSIVGAPFELATSTMILAERVAESGTNDPSVSTKRARSYVGKNNWQTMRQISRNLGGPTALYTGYRIQVLRDSVGCACYFVAYESSKQWLVRSTRADSPTDTQAVALAGAIGGCAGLLTYPLDRIKSELQAHALLHGREQKIGWPRIRLLERAGWKGFGVALTRAAVTHSVMFTVFELVKKKINLMPDPPKEGTAFV